jgi:hypothetical protein
MNNKLKPRRPSASPPPIPYRKRPRRRRMVAIGQLQHESLTSRLRHPRHARFTACCLPVSGGCENGSHPHSGETTRRRCVGVGVLVHGDRSVIASLPDGPAAPCRNCCPPSKTARSRRSTAQNRPRPAPVAHAAPSSPQSQGCRSSCGGEHSTTTNRRAVSSANRPGVAVLNPGGRRSTRTRGQRAGSELPDGLGLTCPPDRRARDRTRMGPRGCNLTSPYW